MGTITDKDGYTRYTVVVNGQPIEYRYCPRRFGGETFAHDHFEFLREPRKTTQSEIIGISNRNKVPK